MENVNLERNKEIYIVFSNATPKMIIFKCGNKKN
jgi:hypothetical protein